MFHLQKSWRQGFNLIELLVVIAIIAVLIGLLLPAVSGFHKDVGAAYQAIYLVGSEETLEIGRNEQNPTGKSMQAVVSAVAHVVLVAELLDTLAGDLARIDLKFPGSRKVPPALVDVLLSESVPIRVARPVPRTRHRSCRGGGWP